MGSSSNISCQIQREKVEVVTDFFLALKSLHMVTAAMKLEDTIGRKAMTNLDSILESKGVTLPTKVCIVKATVFPVVMYGCDYKEGRSLKNWCFRTVVLEKTLESPLGGKEVKPVNPEGDQPWMFIGRNGAEAEAPILWSPDVNCWLDGKDPDTGKDWGQEKRATEDEMVGWRHSFSGQELGQTPGDGEGQQAWCAAVHGVAKSQTWLGNWITTATNKRIMESKDCHFLLR